MIITPTYLSIMTKKKDMGPLLALYPMPVTLVGSILDGKPNFCTIAHVGILNYGQPQYISVGLHRSHASNQGIIAHGEFSVCLPDESLVVETDYAGMVSAEKADKSSLFTPFFGRLPNAPMADECQICMECRLHQRLELGQHDIFIGEIIATHIDESVLTDCRVDLRRFHPLLFEMGTKQYWSVGQPIAKCWNAGKKHMDRPD